MTKVKVKSVPLSSVYVSSGVKSEDGSVFCPVKLDKKLGGSLTPSGIVIAQFFKDNECCLYTEKSFASEEEAKQYAVSLARTSA